MTPPAPPGSKTQPNTALVVERYPGFSALPNDAKALLHEQREREIFLSDYWFRLLDQEVMRHTHEIVYFVFRQGAELSAILPSAMARGDRRAATVLHALTNYYSTFFSLIRASPTTVSLAAIAAAWLNELATHLPHIAHIEFRPFYVTPNEFDELAGAFKSAGFVCQRFCAFGNYTEAVSGLDYDAYLARRPGQLRSLIKRRGRKLEREHRCEYQLIACEDGLDEAMGAYERVYAQRGRLREPYPAFIRQLATELARLGQLRLGLLCIDEAPAAAQIWFINNGVACLFKSAYDPDFGAYSPGSLLSDFLIRGFLNQDKVAGLDFLSGDDAYKKDWATTYTEQSGFEATSTRHWLGRARLAKRFVKSLWGGFR